MTTQGSDKPYGLSTEKRQAPGTISRAKTGVRAPLLALGVFALVFAVALGANRSLANIGGPEDMTQTRVVAASLIVLVVGFAALPATAYALWWLVSQYWGEGAPKHVAVSTQKRLAAQLLALVALFAIVAAMALALKQARGPSPRAETRPVATEPAPANNKSPALRGTAETLAPWVFAAVLASSFLLVTVALVRRRQARVSAVEPPLPELELQRSELRQVVTSSLEDLEREPDPRKAVIRAYSGMEQALERHGLGRREYEAPFEYLARVLAAVHLSTAVAERLTHLFERARFSEHPIDRGMKSEAIAALSEVRGELGVDPR